jgi:hypothetical protein
MFSIKITRHVTEDQTVKREWRRIGGPDAAPEWGYPPDRVEPVTRQVEVLSQTVDTMDLAAVIKAVNGL